MSGYLFCGINKQLQSSVVRNPLKVAKSTANHKQFKWPALFLNAGSLMFNIIVN